MLPRSVLSMTQHPGWAPALKVGQDFLVLSATTEHSLAGFPRTNTCTLRHRHGALPPAPLLGMSLPGTQSSFPALSDGSALSTTWTSSTLAQQPLRSWDQSPADAHKRIGLKLLQVPCGHPASCLRKTSTNENGSMVKGREGKGMISTWKKEKHHNKLFHG